MRGDKMSIEKSAKDDVDKMVENIAGTFQNYLDSGNDDLTIKMRVLVIGRVVNCLSMNYTAMIRKIVREHESFLDAK